ncbi:MAG: nucleoside triphosphate pyrophosphatase [Chloroflexota bacterium]|nr:nucleoside triphosphate pyrophosphatase [Chloroflexota bacterium]
MNPELILASQSPRRRALLAALGLIFTIDAADVDETPLPGERPDALVCRLCRAKAQTVAGRHPGAIVLAADTVVTLDERLLGKPADGSEAAAMLRSLRGRPHTVFTAVAVARDGAVESRLNASQVTMRDYSEAEIAAYVASGDPLDKAGAYAIQHASFSPVAAWTGCYAGIMGLPLRLTSEMLAAAGLPAPVGATEVCRGLNGGGCCNLNPSCADYLA